MQLSAISFVLILLVGVVLALVVGIFLPRRLQVWNAGFTVLVLTVAAVATALKLAAPPGLVFDDSFAVDPPALWTTLAIITAGALTVVLSVPTFRNDSREAEYYVLLLFSLLGAVMLAGAHDVMEIVLGVLLSSVGSYALVAYRRTAPLAMEALLKYYRVIAPMFVPPAGAPPEPPEPLAKAVAIAAAIASIALGIGAFGLLGAAPALRFARLTPGPALHKRSWMPAGRRGSRSRGRRGASPACCGR
jgi:NADH:ubiquinone oxidoreductase subunit 2 (subunit N)